MHKFFNIRNGSKYTVAIGLLCIGIILAAETVLGATAQYVPLVGIPALQGAQGSGLAAYLNRIYVITIALGAIVAFLRIAFAGVKWSMSDVITDKSSAKADIKGSLMGLAILLIPFIVLNTIYPGLTSLDILKNAQNVKIDLTVPVTAPSAGATQNSGVPTPPSVTVGTTITNTNCTFVSRGVPIPGAVGPNGEPLYTSDEYNCTTQTQQCGGLSGTSVLVNNGSQVQCTYLTATPCDNINIMCPGSSAVGA